MITCILSLSHNKDFSPFSTCCYHDSEMCFFCLIKFWKDNNKCLVILWFIDLWASPIHQSYAQIIFLAGFASQGIVNKDPTVWLDGARPLPISLIMNWTNSQLDKLRPYKILYRQNFKFSVHAVLPFPILRWTVLIIKTNRTLRNKRARLAAERRLLSRGQIR